MSGDVQPRKRKDKKRKKDELGVEEPRGTAAALGEGDVFMHSQHEHGTGGHWCAKIIFFSLLAVLVTLIGLIILENRGVSELEANSVETRYSGVLEGWLEDAPDDDHHDEHTLELLKQHDTEDDHEQEHDESLEDQDEIGPDENVSGHDDDDDENENSHGDNDDDEDENSQDDDTDDQEASDEDESENANHVHHNDDDDDEEEGIEDTEHGDGDEDEQDDSEEQQLEESDEADVNGPTYDNDESAEENDDDDLQKVDEDNTPEDEDDNFQNDQSNDQSVEDDGENSRENDDEEDEEHEEEEVDSGIEVEKLEKEVSDEDIRSAEHSTRDAADDNNSEEVPSELLEDEGDANDEDDAEDEEFLDDDIDESLPVVERIVAPKGKPFTEVEDEPTTFKPADTLADEEEYEKQQEELRRDEAQASHEDGGNSVEDDWPGEPSEKYWRHQLDEAEQELRQDWLD